MPTHAAKIIRHSALLLALATVSEPSKGIRAAQSVDSIESEIIALEQQVSEAAVRGDVATKRRLLSDRYIAIESYGTVHTKEQEIAEMEDGSLTMEDEKSQELKVRVFGDAAVVTGRLSLAENRRGTKNRFDVLFTDVWIKQDGRWQIVNYQGTRAPQKP